MFKHHPKGIGGYGWGWDGVFMAGQWYICPRGITFTVRDVKTRVPEVKR